MLYFAFNKLRQMFCGFSRLQRVFCLVVYIIQIRDFLNVSVCNSKPKYLNKNKSLCNGSVVKVSVSLSNLLRDKQHLAYMYAAKTLTCLF